MYSYERGVHRIRVLRRAGAQDATRILWHELTHAAQQTRGERTDGTRSYSGAAYREHPREIEARESEARFGHIPLVRA